MKTKRYINNSDNGPFIYENALNKFLNIKNLIMVGLSFSMTKFSEPGSYNKDIRDAIKHDMLALNDCVNLFLFVQWEIAQAMLEDPFFSEQFLPYDHVCEPHIIVPEQLLKPRTVLNQILAAEKAAHTPLGILRQKLEELLELTGVSPTELKSEQDDKRLQERLAANLNGLLTDPCFVRAFDGIIQLKDLHRFVRGREWVERRELPCADDNVGKYQDRRLGAFILEAIFDETLLGPTQYISTRSVLDAMMEQARLERFMPNQIWVYGHEAHMPRIKWQLSERIWSSSKETVWSPDWLLGPKQIILRGGTDRWGQINNAQEWTDYEIKWKAYNGIEAAVVEV